jgi:iron(III) transport system substrate-binding protein
VTVYSGRGESLVGPLLEKVEAETGVKVEVQYGGTAELATRLIAEGEASPADVFLAQDPGHLGALAERGVLAKLPDDLLSQVAPAYRDDGGHWIGTSGRLRVLVVHTGRVPEGERPQSLRELADPKWKGRLGWAPGNGSFQAHVSALRSIWGEDETRRWLEGVKANAPTVYPKNSPQVEAAGAGAIDIGWVNHYYLYKFDHKALSVANHSFAPGDAGNIMMLSGAGVRKGSKNEAAALKVVSFLVSETAQQHFAQETKEYPTRPGVPTHPEVPPIDPAAVAAVSQAALADIAPTRALLQELGLQ